MSIFRFPWPPPLGWNRGRRLSGSFWTAANSTWSGREFPQPRLADGCPTPNTLSPTAARLREQERPVTIGKFPKRRAKNESECEKSGLGCSEHQHLLAPQL